MKGLKAFKEFALTQEEQKNVNGGRVMNFRCTSADAGEQNFPFTMAGLSAGGNWSAQNGGGRCYEIAY